MRVVSNSKPSLAQRAPALRGMLRRLNADIFNENIHDESLPFASDMKFPESDHAPFVAEFLLGD